MKPQKNVIQFFFVIQILTTKIYSEIYFDKCDPLINKYALKNKYDIYLLMDVDIPWIKDDLRDKPNERKRNL